jgi:transcriptional regulator with XRE-family HTH domain
MRGMEKQVFTNPTQHQLRAARYWLNWTLDDTAAAANVSKQTVSRIETGASQGTRETIFKIARAYSQAGIWMAENRMMFEPPEDTSE